MLNVDKIKTKIEKLERKAYLLNTHGRKYQMTDTERMWQCSAKYAEAKALKDIINGKYDLEVK